MSTETLDAPGLKEYRGAALNFLGLPAGAIAELSGEKADVGDDRYLAVFLPNLTVDLAKEFVGKLSDPAWRPEIASVTHTSLDLDTRADVSIVLKLQPQEPTKWLYDYFTTIEGK